MNRKIIIDEPSTLTRLERLSSIEYDAIMIAINNAKAAIIDGEFVDPYSENADIYDDNALMMALIAVEDAIMAANLPK